jgi:hypothetical protein
MACLSSVSAIALVKEFLPVPRRAFFAKGYGHGTRQSTSLLSVTLGKVTRIPLFYLFFAISSKQTKNISHNHHIYITYIIESSHHQTHDIAHKDHMFLHKDHKVTSTTK